MIKHILIFAVLVFSVSLFGQTKLKQVEPAPEYGMIIMAIDTLSKPGVNRQQYVAQADMPIFRKADSICFVLTTLSDTVCVVAAGVALTQGYIAFGAGAGNPLTGENLLFWDEVNNRLGINDLTPDEAITVTGNILTQGTGQISAMGHITALGGIRDDGSSFGTDGQLLETDGVSKVTWVDPPPGVALTQGYIAFGAGAGNPLTGENLLFWDEVNNRLGINDLTPDEAITVTGNILTQGTGQISAIGYITALGGIRDDGSSFGTPGQLLETDGVAKVTWVDAPSWYIVSGNLAPDVVATTTGTGATIAVTLGDTFDINYNGGPAEFNLSGAGLFFNADVYIGANTSNQLQVVTGGTFVKIGHEVPLDLNSYGLHFNVDGGLLLFGDEIDITADADVDITPTGVTRINSDAFIGDDVATQLFIETDATAAYIGNEVTNDLSTGSFMRFHNAGDIYIQAEHLGDGDFNVDTDDDQVFTTNGITGIITFLANNTLDLTIEDNTVHTPTGTKIGAGRVPTTNGFETATTDASKASAGDWIANSDRRLKKNIIQLDGELLLRRLLNLKGVKFEWNEKSKKMGYERPEGVQYGLIAQDIIKGFDGPQFVKIDNEGYYQAPYGTYDPIYIEVIRFLHNRILSLEKLMLKR